MYLNCHSWFSFKYGTLEIPALLETAREKKIRTLALTDINNTSGCLDFIRIAPDYGIKPVVGVDFRAGNKRCFILIARNNEGFLEINRKLSQFLLNPDKSPEPVHSENVIVIYPFDSAPVKLTDNEWIGVKPGEMNRFTVKRRHPEEKYIALPTASFRDKKDHNIHRLLRAIDKNTLLSRLEPQDVAPPEDRFYTPSELRKKYALYPGLLDRAEEVIASCDIQFTYRESKNKKYFTGSAEKDYALLERLAREGIKYRYGQINNLLEERLRKELDMVSKQGFASYFLINHDIVSYARKRGFFYVGRGSGANSLIAYCLRITDVDPVDLDLYFERFINEFRKNPPDFDIDFSWKDRDEIISYIFSKYGHEYTALLATYNTFQGSATIRELGKVFGLPKAEIDQLVSMRREPRPDDRIKHLVVRYASYIRDFPSHLSIHAGGVLISEKPVHAYTATSMMPKGFPVSQFSMLEAEDIGLYKFDILSQRGLGHIRDATDIVKENRGVEIDIHNIAGMKQDEKVKELLKAGDTLGCFYVESPGMKMLLKKLQAETYPALVAASSIIRPGVAQSGMMREYINRFRNPEARTYIHPIMEKLMEETFGIMVYQEDVIKVAHYFAGLTLAEADVLRRGMSGKFRARDEFRKAEESFIKGCLEKGHSEELTHEVWRQVKSFAGYSFSKGHSASYAVESYQSMYLKAYFPLEFLVGVINNFGGFYRTEVYIHEARMRGGIIHAPCINRSSFLTTIKGKDVYLGFIHISGMEQKTADMITEEREVNGNFDSLEDFISRVPVAVEQLRLLVRVGAFRFSGRSKKQLLWDILAVMGEQKRAVVTGDLFAVPVQQYELPQLDGKEHDDALDEMEILGFPLSSPFALLPLEKSEAGIHASELNKYVGQEVEITGYYICHKVTRTVKGDFMFFGNFIDRNGVFFDTTHFPQPAKAYPFRGTGCYTLRGKVTEDFGYASLEITVMDKIPYLPMAERASAFKPGMV